MSECRGPECSHPSHDRRLDFATIARLGKALDELRLIPCYRSEVLVLEGDRLVPIRTGPAPRR